MRYLTNFFPLTSKTRQPLFALLESTKKRKTNGHLLVNGLKVMVERFQKKRSLKVQSDKGRKPLQLDAIEELQR